MKRIISIISILLISITDLSAQNDEISSLCHKINQDSLKQNVIELQEFSTRYAYSPNRKQVAEYLKSRLENYGFEVVSISPTEAVINIVNV